MFLKTIELQGFKSFATKTVLNFLPSHDGRFSITAIVGPNGSGKSNIADAIRWVLGEQSMKLLRGKKGSDIIFGGSESKSKLSCASVSIILDNLDHRAPIEYDELAITRKFYRSGESEYYINGSAVRLLDIQILLAKTQFGNGSYSVIGQGMIDRLIMQNPEERKAFFDEAAGIKEFQIKRHHSLLKLQKSKENMAQAQVLLQEISPRLKILTRQMKKLEQRQEVELTLREAQEKYYASIWKEQDKILYDANLELADSVESYEILKQEIHEKQEKIVDLAQTQSRLDVFASLEQEYQRILVKKNVLERERAVLQGRLQTEYAKAGKHNISWLQNKIESIEIQILDLEKESFENSNKIKNVEQKKLSLKTSKERLHISKTQLRGTLVRLQQQIFESKSEESLWQFTGVQAVQGILKNKEMFGTVYGAVSQLGSVASEYLLALDVAAGQQLASVVVSDDKTAEKCIQYLRDNQLGVATFLPLNKIQPRFLPSDLNDILKIEGVFGLAIDLIKFDKKFENIFSYVLGATIVVKDIESARRVGIGKVRMVTLLGDVMEKSGSMKGGHRKHKEKGLSFAHGTIAWGDASNSKVFEERIKDVEIELAQTEKEYEVVESDYRKNEGDSQVLKGKRELYEIRRQELASEKSALEQELSLTNMSSSDYDSVMKDVALEKEKAEAQIKTTEAEMKAIQEKMSNFNQEEENKKKLVFQMQEELQQSQSKMNILMDKKNEQQIVIAKLETKQETLEQEAYQELHESLSAVIARGLVGIDVGEIDALQQQIQKLKYQLSLIGGIDPEIIEEYKGAKLRHEELDASLSDLEKAVGNLEKLVIELDEIMKKKRDSAFKNIKKEFSRYFSILFDGGRADLSEVYGIEESEEKDENQPVESEQIVQIDQQVLKKEILKGIEIVANPPGKKIDNVHMLSGGEKTLTSIALVCAILRVNPSPFVVLDEVEAALDEANTIRFSQILFELAQASQFILITHNKATMHSADALYGVTMGGDGISKLVGVDLRVDKK
jgi:chromosome segregation protein